MDNPQRTLSPEPISGDGSVDRALRPQKLADYLGQPRTKENLEILIEAAKGRNEPLDHVLFYGPPGLGKTTLAMILAKEMDVNIKTTAGPAIERAGDLAAILTNLRANDILFIDEVHRLGRAVEEILYPAMEDFVLDLIIGKGPSARNVRLKLPRFTVIGATTRLAMMTGPLRDRFGMVYRLEFYDNDTLAEIVHRNAKRLGTGIDDSGAMAIAKRGRGTPRIANRLLRRVRDYAQVRAGGVINEAVAMDALKLLNIDELGLDDIDRRLLSSIIEKFDGGPVGLETIAATISEEADTIMDVYEPYLLQLGFLDRTPRGRTATRRAYEHLGLPFKPANVPPSVAQSSLFDIE
jgi:Holliday junction DNA helicase RuvB